METIVTIVENSYSLLAGSLASKSRLKTTSEARAIAMYLCRTKTTHSLHEIALEFDKDHTSVIYAIKRVRNNPELHRKALKLSKLIVNET